MVKQKNERKVILEYLDFYRQYFWGSVGQYYTILDGKFTSYEHLSRQNEQGADLLAYVAS